MGIGGLGMTELVIILVIILIIFGAGKLPEIGSGLGKAIKNFKKGVTDTGSNDSNKPEEELKSKSSDTPESPNSNDSKDKE